MSRTVLKALQLSSAALLYVVSLSAEHLPLKLYQTSDGLSNNYIGKMYVDSKGFLWLPTREGLNRFDGSAFVRYGTTDGLTESAIISIIEDRDENYHVLTNSGDLCVLRSPVNSKSSKLFTRNLLRVDSMRFGGICLHKDVNGIAWVGCYSGLKSGLFRVDMKEKNMTFVPLNSPERSPVSLFVSTLCDDGKGNLWIGTQLGVVRFFVREGTLTLYPLGHEKAPYGITAFFLDESGRLWISSGNSGLYIVRPDQTYEGKNNRKGRWQFTDRRIIAKGSSSNRFELNLNPGEGVHFTSQGGVSLNAISTIYSTGDGRIWIGTKEGLTVYDGTRFRTYTIKNGLCSNFITSLVSDAHGNLWIGTVSGVQKLFLHGIVSYDGQDGIPVGTVHALYNGASGKVNAVLSDWKIAQYDGSRFHTVPLSVPPGSDYSWFSQVGFLSKHNEWWLLTSRGLFRFGQVDDIRALHGRRPAAVLRRNNGIPGNSLFRMYEDRRGDFWISTRGRVDEESGLCRWDRRTGTFIIYGPDDGLPGNLSVSSACEDSSGNLWFGFYQGGIARFSNGRFSFWSVDQGAPGSMVTSLYTDHHGNLWIGSNLRGASILKDVNRKELEYRSYTALDGLGSDNVRCLVEDRWGRMYFGTVRGIDRLDPSTGVIAHFSQTEGLPNEWVISALRDKNGNLWFGTMSGLARLTPRIESPSSPAHPPSIYLSEVRVNGVRRVASELGNVRMDDARFEPSENNVGITFFAIDFTGYVRYQYRLHQSTNEWSSPLTDRTVNFASLSAGSYDFEVRAVTVEGVTSDLPAQFHFHILAPLWERWWFILLANIAVIGALYLLYRYRVRRAVELERLRVRIASDLHDEVGSALTQIAVHSEIIQRADKSERVLSSSQTIGTVSREVVRTLADIVWSIDARNDTYGQLTSRMKSFALDLLGSKGIDVLFHFDRIPPERKIPVELRENLYLIYKEAVTNIAKHSNASQVNVGLRESDGSLTLVVRDNGRGLTREPRMDGHGLRNMEMRAGRIGGTLTFLHEDGFGIMLSTRIS